MNKAYLVMAGDIDKTFFWEHFDDELSSDSDETECWQPPPFRRMLGSPGEPSPDREQLTDCEPEGEPEPSSAEL